MITTEQMVELMAKLIVAASNNVTNVGWNLHKAKDDHLMKWQGAIKQHGHFHFDTYKNYADYLWLTATLHYHIQGSVYQSAEEIARSYMLMIYAEPEYSSPAEREEAAAVMYNRMQVLLTRLETTGSLLRQP